ncbi:MAG: hypothetical protein JSS43_20480 [Proteobacteria bacterium]|nr:hypothetical protein [Pseudomonadota bacterium]
MHRRIEFLDVTLWESNGRNGEMRSRGVLVSSMPPRAGADTDEACIRVVTSRGEVSDSARVVFPSEAAGDIAAAVLEHFSAHATPEVRRALAARLVAICETGLDPAHADDGVNAAPPAGPRI